MEEDEDEKKLDEEEENVEIEWKGNSWRIKKGNRKSKSAMKSTMNIMRKRRMKNMQRTTKKNRK